MDFDAQCDARGTRSAGRQSWQARDLRKAYGGEFKGMRPHDPGGVEKQ
jgi:hypothetical protein